MAGFFDLFGPATYNRLLQPDVTTQGIPNMLLSRPSPQSYPIAPVPQTDPMPTASVAPAQAPAPIAPPMAAPAAPQAQPGIRDLYSNFVNSDRGQALNDMFTGWAAGSTPSESLAFGAKLTAANKKDRDATNQTVSWLKGRGLGEEEARRLASSPPALNDYLKNIYDQSKPIEVAGRLVDPKTYQVIADFSDPNSKLTSDQREYKAAQDQGFTGSFMDYQIKMKEAGRNQVNIDTGAKLPNGFRWLDPNNQALGVEPIPGGPATQIPGELAARIGMGENFLKNDLPYIRKPESLEAATGPIDRASAWAGVGEPGVVERKFQSGVEVLSRLLSGAGMTQVEIDEKTKRYMPTKWDDATSLKTKIDQLEAEIRAAGDAAMRGRGGSISAAPTGASDPLGLR